MPGQIISKIILADNQDITCAGLRYVCSGMEGVDVSRVEDKATLIESLVKGENAVVVLDYTLFDINDVADLHILSQRFKATRWILFSEDLSRHFIESLVTVDNRFSLVLKDSPMVEIKEALTYALRGRRFICQRMAEALLAPEEPQEEKINLTPTEVEILKDIALGMTTREIAEKRISSFHTVNTHRKNIFRKLSVNNAHEATKYALRAGLVDSAEYYI